LILKAKCKKCKGSVRFDIGEMSKKEVEEKLAASDSWQCNAGNHVELCSPLELYEFDWENLEEGVAETDDEFLEKLRAGYNEVYDTSEIQEKYEIESFFGGMALGRRKNSDMTVMKAFNYTSSPSGKRYYFTND